MIDLMRGQAGAAWYQVLQRRSQLWVSGRQVLLQGCDDGRGVNPHLARSIRVSHCASRRTGSSSWKTILIRAVLNQSDL